MHVAPVEIFAGGHRKYADKINDDEREVILHKMSSERIEIPLVPCKVHGAVLVMTLKIANDLVARDIHTFNSLQH